MPRITPSHRIRKFLRRRDSRFHPKSESYRWWVLGNIMIGTFMAVLDSTIVNVGLPKIMSSFGVGIDKIEWVLTAYMLALAVMLPTSAWMADRFGYKRMYFMGLLLFTTGSFLCGISGNENMLIFSRVIQGMGAGFVMPVGMAIVTREFPPQQRGLALGFWAIASAASVSFGPLIGGYLIDRFSWPLIFDVNVPVGIVGLLVTILVQREYRQKTVPRFDTIGFVSASVFLPLVLYALTEGNASGNSAGWSAPYVLLCFAVSAIAFAVFITAELTVKEPLMDLRLFKNHNFLISSVIMLIFSVGMFGSTFLLPLYLQNSLGYTAIQAGSVFLPIGIIQGFVAPLSGGFADRTNAKIPILVGILLLALSFYLNSLFSVLTEHRFVMLTVYIRGFAMGIMFTPLSTAALSGIPREKMAQASSIFNIIRQLSASFGVAVLATVLTSRVNYHSEMYGQAIQAQSPAYRTVNTRLTYAIQKQAGSPPAMAAKQSQALLLSNLNKQAFIQGVDDDFLLAAIISLTGGIPVLVLRLRKKQSAVKPISHE